MACSIFRQTRSVFIAKPFCRWERCDPETHLVLIEFQRRAIMLSGLQALRIEEQNYKAT